MSWKDYKALKQGNFDSVGFHGGQYCFEILTGIFDLPEYYPITKEEFETFDEWKDDVDKIVKDIKNRTLLYSAYSPRNK
ncbi:hypothetical protein [Azotosporobacter soli]|uniref:hypothetical protein n=1 Tax=Azotosporobacter soli TaxID=3055040 RepID=UPI0031FE822B